jgi:hypothetical protein
MKKILILFAMLLIGAGRLSAQDPYTVDVDWSYISPFYCQSELSSDYVFVVTLNIYDVINGVEVTDPNTYNIESWTALSSNFGPDDTNVADWCDEATKTPNLRVHVVVSMVNIHTQEVYCYRESIVYRTCYQFSTSGVGMSFIFN